VDGVIAMELTSNTELINEEKNPSDVLDALDALIAVSPTMGCSIVVGCDDAVLDISVEGVEWEYHVAWIEAQYDVIEPFRDR
jgi:hypothetical protein